MLNQKNTLKIMLNPRKMDSKLCLIQRKCMYETKITHKVKFADTKAQTDRPNAR